MTTINVDIPDSILESHHKNLTTITQNVKQGFIIWEYLNGHLSLKQSADTLNIPYRDFIDMLLSRGIVLDALNDTELKTQCHNLSELLK